jgi:endonuclease YncB( thermonuclease family)
VTEIELRIVAGGRGGVDVTADRRGPGRQRVSAVRARSCAPPQTASPTGCVGDFPFARIVDGDTIDVTNVPSDNIRFIGINTPREHTGRPSARRTNRLRSRRMQG